MRQQMALGRFIFGLSRNFAYNSLVRTSDGGWKSSTSSPANPSPVRSAKAQEVEDNGESRCTRSPWIGSMSCVHCRHSASLCRWLTASAATGGLWRINTVSETQSDVIDDGTAMVVDWAIELAEFIQCVEFEVSPVIR